MTGSIPPIHVGHDVKAYYVTLKERVQTLMVKADSTALIGDKKAAYEEAFQVMVEGVRMSGGSFLPETSAPLFTLLEAYAGKCCYAQQGKDPKEGFRKSGRLMECSLGLQLEHVGLFTGAVAIENFKSLEQLVNHLGYDKSEVWRIASSIECLLSSNAEVVLNKISDNAIRESFLSTLLRLIYSYQNIDEASLIGDKGSVNLHKQLNVLYESLTGQETAAALKKLVDFRYNRSLFMVNLSTPGNLEAQLKCYDDVEVLFEKAFSEEPLELQSRKAQIANMRGLVFLRTEDPERFLKASPYTKLSFALREKLIEAFPTPEANAQQKFLLSNIRTSLIRIELAAGNADAAIIHVKELKAYIDELMLKGNFHDYIESYQKAIQAVEDFLQKNQIK